MTTLVFTKNSMLNTTIERDASPAYTVSTRLPGSTTYIRSADTDTQVGCINRGMFLPDTIRLPGVGDGKARRVSRWLKDAKMKDGTPAFQLHLGGEPRFLAQHNEYGLALFAADMEGILAHWQPRTDSSNLALVLSAGMDNFETQILAAFLFAEQELRRNEKKPMDATTAATGYMKGPGGG
ncbi:hypothetical protein C8R44DRAFT_798134 [Mycena epipterygia]|nr:hypothetical protein C8R44DRAFT_798134 [Mycena epipterygia]